MGASFTGMHRALEGYYGLRLLARQSLAARGESPGVAPRLARRLGVPNAAAALGAPPRWQGATTENRGPHRAWFARWGGNIGQYLREEQRSQHRGPQRGSRVGVERGCIACRMQPDFHHGLLSQSMPGIPRRGRWPIRGTSVAALL